MRELNLLINELLEYGKCTGLVAEADAIYAVNRVLEVYGVDEYTEVAIESERAIHEILADLTDVAIERGLCEDTGENRDLWDTKVMGCITPMPSVVRAKFAAKYALSPKDATDWYYDFSRATNYIRTERVAKDLKWQTDTEWGTLDITINRSKPEKDPRDIAKAKDAVKSSYPACLLCRENEGYAGHIGHPARQNHRIIPITLDGDAFYLQYSPYVYYNEHCIIFNKEHTPMRINRKAFERLFDFVDAFPHYTIGSNADLPIVGGSILSHDHYQGGNYEFPMVRAEYDEMFSLDCYPGVTAGIIRWPLSTIRLRSADRAELLDAATHILDTWRGYSDSDCDIYAETDGVPHSTVTPIVRMRGAEGDSAQAGKSGVSGATTAADGCFYEMDLVLRNNITTDEHPLGLFHPHEEYHYVKKENIGLIEVMGLAVLPARLQKEMDTSNPATRDEIGTVFGHVLENAGVFKWDDRGRAGFRRFVEALNL